MRQLSSFTYRKTVRLGRELTMAGELRRCPKCASELPLSAFTQRANGRWSSYCKRCLSLYCREHYVKNAEKHNARRAETRRRHRIRNRAYVLEYLRSHPCVDCGETNLNVLDFDHTDPEFKEDEISHLSRRGRSLTDLKREIERCMVRCANCHRRRTARQFGWAKGIGRGPGM